MPKRYVYGTRIKKWVLVGPEDRDYTHGLTPAQKKKLGKKAKEVYLGMRVIGIPLNRRCKR